MATTNNRGQLIVGVDDATIQSRAGTSQDSAIGGGLDVLIGNTGGDRIEQTGGISKLDSALLVIQGDGTYETNDDNSHGTHFAGTIGAVGNNSVGVAGSTSDAPAAGGLRLAYNDDMVSAGTTPSAEWMGARVTATRTFTKTSG